MRPTHIRATLMKHRLFTFLLAVAASLGTMFAETYSGSCGENLTWSLNTEDSVLTISGTGAMADYNSSNIPWYEYREAIRSAIIANGVTTIGTNAFYYCRELTSINIPSTVLLIRNYAFFGCQGLTSIEIPNSVTSIGDTSFDICTKLSAIIVAEDNQHYCSQDGVLFTKDATILIHCPEGKQGTYVIPNSVNSIKRLAFKGNEVLTSVEIPNSVTSIGDFAFSACKSLNLIIVAPDNSNYSSEDGVLFNKDKTTLIQYPGGKQGAYTIPNSVTSIEEDAFSGCYGITSVITLNSVINIGNEAFRSCFSLASVIIGNSIVNIGDYAFYGCSSITSVTNYATTPQAINANAFASVNLSSCTLYVPAESIALYQAAEVWKDFGNILPIEDTPEPCITASGACGAEGDNLTWTLTCDSVLTISGTGAMADYNINNPAPWYSYVLSVKTVVVNEGVPSIGMCAFMDCSGLTSVAISNSVTSIGGGAFARCASLSSVTIPNSVISIGENAFQSCSSLISVTIPNSVTSIGYQAFSGCHSLTYIDIPNSVTYIAAGALSDCEKLTSINVETDNPNYCSVDGVLFNKTKTLLKQYPSGRQGAYTIPNGVTNIGPLAFRWCTGLISVEFPNSVTRIGEHAFVGCTSLTSINIPNNVTSIGRQDFYYCSSLNSVEIPNSVTSIDEYAFQECSSLTSFTNYATNPQTINANAFASVNLSSCTLYVPAESLAAYQAADVWKDFYNILPIEGTEESNYATLADIYNMAADSVFTLGAFDVVYVASYQNGANMYIKDASGSGVIYLPSYGLQAGDHVEAGLQGKVHIYNGLYEITPISTKEELTITSGEAPAPMEATEAPSLANVNQYVVYKGVSFSTDTSFVEGTRHMVYGTWNGQEIAFYNQYHIGATLSTDKTYNITAVNSVYGTVLEVYPLAVEEVDSVPDLCVIASGTCGAQGDNLTWTLTCDSVLTISGTGAMADYEWNTGAAWYSNKESIKSVIIENGVTSIGVVAFKDCHVLLSVEIPNSVTSIESQAFQGSGLSYVRIPSNVTSLGLSIFSGCSDLSSIDVDVNNPYYCSIDGVLFKKYNTILKQYPGGKQGAYAIPNGVTSIDIAAFYGCSGLTSVEIPNSVTSIGEWAFYSCSSLTSIDIPNSVTSIGRDAFWNCTGLTSVSISNSVTSIGEETFADCISLTSFTNYALQPQMVNSNVFVDVDKSACTLYVPAESVEAYQTADVWKEFPHIQAIEGNTPEPCIIASGTCGAEGDNLAWTLSCDSVLTISGTGAMADYSSEQIPQTPWNSYLSEIKSVVIEEGATNIGRWAFGNCTSLTSVEIPNSVTSIGNKAFCNCSGLTSITIPNSVTSIGDYTFYGCTGLTSVTIPNSVTSIGGGAFSDCSGLTSVTIPNSVTSIGDVAFSGCTGLTSVTIGNSVTSIGYEAFRGCTGLTSVTIEAETPPALGLSVFNNTNDYPIYVPCGTLDAYKSAWSGYADRIKEVEYTIIGNVNDAKAGSVDYPTSPCGDVVITAIPNYGYHFTQWSDGLKDNPRIAQITQDTTFTAEFAYDRVGTCGKDLALVWSYDPTNKVLTIGNAGSFTENMQFGLEAPGEMEELVIGNSVTAIGANAFAGIETLKKIIIGESVKTIGEQAFYNCVNLETIFNYRPTPTNTYSNAFDGVDKFECVLYVLPSSIDMYKNAAVWRDFYYTYAIGAEETTVTTNDVKVEPQDNAATVTWPTSNNAATYTIQITKDGVVFCTLIFNSNGQLTGIVFAPSRDGQAHAPAALMTANGLQFTVTGLDSGTQYGYSVTAKDANDQTVATYSGSFTTTSEGIATGIDNTPFPSGEGRGEARKFLRDGQIYILRGEKVYTLTGAEVK